MSASQVGAISQDLFARVRMGYVVVTSQRLTEWRRLLSDGLGMQVDQQGTHLVCRIDQHCCRFLISSGAEEDLQTLGLELADKDALDEVLRRLKACAIDWKEITGEEASLRGVTSFWRFEGPKKMLIELYYQPLLASKAPNLKVSGFVTGEQGFGHMAIVTQRPDEMLTFWQKLFDIRHTDYVKQRISGVPLNFQFTRFNKRHHSLAFGSTVGIKLNPFRTRIQHIEVQVANLEDLTRCYESCRALGFTIMMEVGQHANDRAVSFYVQSPSGFDFECGWNPITIDEQSWEPKIWDRISVWGHSSEGMSIRDRLDQLSNALVSTTKNEYIPEVDGRSVR